MTRTLFNIDMHMGSDKALATHNQVHNRHRIRSPWLLLQLEFRACKYRTGRWPLYLIPQGKGLDCLGVLDNGQVQDVCNTAIPWLVKLRDVQL